MAVSEYHLDTRIRRKHVPLRTQQRRLRHLRSVSARNMMVKDEGVSPDLALQFSLHRSPNEPAFYWSETLADSVNPSWKDFESSNFPEKVDTASSYVSVKVWSITPEKHPVLEWLVFFSGLMFLGEQIPKEGKNFKPNSLIFGMSEGYYGCSDCYQHALVNNIEVSSKDSILVDASGLRTSCTLSTLSRIQTVERAIRQTQSRVARHRAAISLHLQGKADAMLGGLAAQQETLQSRIRAVAGEVGRMEEVTRSRLDEQRRRRREAQERRSEIAKKLEEQRHLSERCEEISRHYSQLRESQLKTEARLHFCRKQLISELGYIYPIVESPNENGYSIHDVHLPNSECFAGHEESSLCVCLGFVCHLVLMVSQFLDVPLRYPLHFNGSRSSVTDTISGQLPDRTREFPLYSKGKDRRCFEYGVFLLNKNIAQLRLLSGLGTRDLSATLPNLEGLLRTRLAIDSEPTRGARNGPARIPAEASDSEVDSLRRGGAPDEKSPPHHTSQPDLNRECVFYVDAQTGGIST